MNPVIVCSCCKQEVDAYREWDGIYSACHDCAHCVSLEHDPCCHGECMSKDNNQQMQYILLELKTLKERLVELEEKTDPNRIVRVAIDQISKSLDHYETCYLY